MVTDADDDADNAGRHSTATRATYHQQVSAHADGTHATMALTANVNHGCDISPTVSGWLVVVRNLETKTANIDYYKAVY